MCDYSRGEQLCQQGIIILQEHRTENIPNIKFLSLSLEVSE